MNNLTLQQMQAMMMQQQQQPQQPTGLMPTASNSALIAKLLANGGAATPTADPLERGMSNAAGSLSAGFAALQKRKDAEKMQKIKDAERAEILRLVEKNSNG
jgi:hypothetical protein